MSCRLSILNPLAALIFCTATALRAELAVSLVRQSGASLDTSIKNEADHAVRQAARWLADRQQTDGSWGESNRIRTTSLALFARAAARQPAPSESCVRAALWLNATTSNRVDSLETHAWRLLALSLTLPASADREPFLRRLSEQVPSDTPGGLMADRAFWNEALALADLAAEKKPSDEAKNLLARAATDWPPPLANNRAAWRLARLINRVSDGQLLLGHTPVDWRPYLARRLLSSQKSDPRGGGYWAADTPDGQIEATAYGLLCLLEL